jgi:hypothetical protein
MALQYSLYPNKLKGSDTTYRALIKNRRQYPLDRVIYEMKRKHSFLSEDELKSVLMHFFNMVEMLLEDGGTVITPLFTARCSIAGTFKDQHDSFNKTRHQIKIKLTAGDRLKRRTKGMHTHKVPGSFPKPDLTLITDLSTGSQDSSLTPGGIVMIKGKKLKYDQDDPLQGVFLVNSRQQRIKVETVLRNVFSMILMELSDDLPAGEYRLLVASNLNTQTLRTGEFPGTLVVE